MAEGEYAAFDSVGSARRSRRLFASITLKTRNDPYRGTASHEKTLLGTTNQIEWAKSIYGASEY